MTMLLAELTGTLALIGIIRSIWLYVFKKYDGRTHWLCANALTVLVRLLLAVPQFWGTDNWALGLLMLLVIYVLEQLVWVFYDYIQSRRAYAPAGWGLIAGILAGGILWLFVLRLLTYYFSVQFLPA